MTITKQILSNAEYNNYIYATKYLPKHIFKTLELSDFAIDPVSKIVRYTDYKEHDQYNQQGNVQISLNE